MATNDVRSGLKAIVTNRINLDSDGTINGVVIDTAGFDLGIMFSGVMAPYSDGLHVVSLFEDDDSGFGSPTLVPDENLIGTTLTFDSATAQGSTLETFGAFGTKRFLRISMVTTGTIIGDNHLAITTIQKSEDQPVDNP